MDLRRQHHRTSVPSCTSDFQEAVSGSYGYFVDNSHGSFTALAASAGPIQRPV